MAVFLCATMLILPKTVTALEFIRKNTRFIFILILPVYFFIVQSSLLNRHTHFYANGIIVTHSHPTDSKDNGSGKNHKHSKNEICFYSAVHFDYYNISSELQISNNCNPVSRGYFIHNEKFFHLTLQLHKTLRGPPAFQIS